MVARGPHRICMCPSAGWVEMELLDTRSRVSPVADCIVVAAVGVGEGWNRLAVVAVGARKMDGRPARVGRRVGRWEKVLFGLLLACWVRQKGWEAVRVPCSCWGCLRRGRDATRENLGGRPPQRRLQKGRLHGESGHGGEVSGFLSAAGSENQFLVALS
jgi:hypothetical protein